MERKQKEYILKDLEKKIVFLTGPRQVGKTWLALDIAKSFKNSVYLNYDRLQDRKIIHDENWLDTTDLLIFDELHKMPEWKNYLKGVFDTKPAAMKILVTGSARLEMFRQAGDSLAGRFFRHRLLPFSPAELAGRYDAITRFMERGGFPEPFLAENGQDAERWRSQYIDGLIRTDILDFEKIHDFKAIQLVLDLLRERTGSPLSYSSIARDISIAPNTVKKYISILEALYIIFRVTPYSRNIARSLIKEPKIYFFDTGMVKGDEGKRLENLVAGCLLKHAFALTDYTGKNNALHYMRTKDKQEVDFCLTEENRAHTLLEVKRTPKNASKALITFNRKHNVPGIVLGLQLKRERKETGITFLNAEKFLTDLRL